MNRLLDSLRDRTDMLRDRVDILLIDRMRRRQAACPHPLWDLHIRSRNPQLTDLVICNRCQAVAEDTEPKQIL